MMHPTIDHLADHALGAGRRESRERVRGHLRSGCDRCRRVAALLARLQRMGSHAAEEAPPPGALRSVKALAALARGRSGGASRLREPAG